MISLFNGRKRTLGADSSGVWAQISVDFRKHLHLFRGARLVVFLAISLHTDEGGWAWPSYELLAEETGYSRDTIRRALGELCQIRIEGHRVLLRYQPQEGGGQFASNRYLIFPTAEDVSQYEGSGVYHLGAETGGGFDNNPSWQNPTTVDRGGVLQPDRGGVFPPQRITIQQEPGDGGDVKIVDDLIAFGFNGARAAISQYGADRCREVLKYAERSELGPGWIQVTLRNGEPVPAAGAGNDRGRSPRVEPCPKCFTWPCTCDEWE